MTYIYYFPYDRPGVGSIFNGNTYDLFFYILILIIVQQLISFVIISTFTLHPLKY